MTNIKPLGEPGFSRHYPTTQTISLKENRSEYRFQPLSPKEVTVYVVDDGIFKDNIKKCDWLLLNFTDNQGYLIELKGGNISLAIDQLNLTLDRLTNTLRSSMTGIRLFCRVVGRDGSGSNYRKEKVKALEKRMARLGGTYEFKSQKFIERIP